MVTWPHQQLQQEQKELLYHLIGILLPKAEELIWWQVSSASLFAAIATCSSCQGSVEAANLPVLMWATNQRCGYSSSRHPQIEFPL